MKGTTQKRGSRWTGYWWVREQGQLRQRSKGGFATKAAAQRHLNQVLAQIAEGTYREAPATMTLGTFLTEHFLPWLRTAPARGGKHRRASTVAAYENSVEKWIGPHLGDLPLKDITPKAVEDWMVTLAERGGRNGGELSGRSVQYALLTLRMALRRAVRTGHLLRDPLPDLTDLSVPAHEPKERQAWDQDEAQRVLEMAEGDRLRALWMLLLTRGPRRGECAALRWADVEWDTGRLTIRRSRVVVNGHAQEGKPKTKKGERRIPLSPELIAALREHRQAQDTEREAWGEVYQDQEYVFAAEDGRPYRPEVLTARFRRLARKAGVKVLSFHEGRHTAGSLLLAAGVGVKEVSTWLGHANIQITLDVYAHLLDGPEVEAAQKGDTFILGGRRLAVVR